MIDAAKARLVPGSAGNLVAIAKPRGELANLLSVTYPKHRLVDMVLDDKALAQLQQVIKEQRQFSRIREHGLAPRRKLLLLKLLSSTISQTRWSCVSVNFSGSKCSGSMSRSTFCLSRAVAKLIIFR